MSKQLALVFVVSMVVTSLVAPLATPVSAQQAGTGELTVRVDLDGRAIEVVESFEVAPVTSSVVMRIPPTATDLTATGRIIARSSNGEASETVEIEVSGSRGSISYRVPDDSGDGRGEGTTVAPDMVAFSLWPNMEKVDVRVEMPEGFVASGGSFVEEEVGPATYHYTLEGGDFERMWGLRFVALREAGLDRQVVDLAGGARVEVIGRVGDVEWLTYAASSIQQGIPALVDLIGQPWPASWLEVVESTAPEEVGYGGWYNLRKAQIEVDDEQDPELLLHELSHAWFNDTLFEHRWMIEGFAEAYAQLAVDELGHETVRLTAPGAAPPRFDGLNRWRSRFFFEDNLDEELYGYRASGYVVAEIMDEIGPDGMALVIDGMVTDRHPYAVDTDRRAIGLNDWRRFLDLAELEGGSTVAEDLFRQYVVTDGQRALLDERRAVLDAYRTFETDQAGGDRAMVPEGIRYAMSEWEFEAAARGLERARAAGERMDALAGRAEALELDLPAFLTDTYLDADVGFARLSDVLDDTEDALAGLEAKGVLSDGDRSDFELGRFDRMDLSAGRLGTEVLNQGDDGGGSPWRWYAAIIAIAGVLLLALAALAARLPDETPTPEEALADPAAPSVGDDEPPIYRPQIPVEPTTADIESLPPPTAADRTPLATVSTPTTAPPPDLGDLPPPAEPR